MRYYETKYPYYALIPAKCKDDAISLYIEEIADEEDYIGELRDNMVEITQIEAFIKYIKATGEELITVGSTLDRFYNAHILLIDKALM